MSHLLADWRLMSGSLQSVNLNRRHFLGLQRMRDRLVIYTENASGPSCGLDKEIIEGAGGELVCASAQDEAERVRIAQTAEVLVASTTPVSDSFLSALPELVGLVRTGIGVDTIDLRAATELGIVVANVPDFCKEEVAEHTLGLILAVSRKIAHADRRVRQGQWRGLVQREILPLYRLRGRTLGVIGMGKIGRTVAQKAQALGMSVIASDPYLSPAEENQLGVPLLSPEELLPRADIVSLHVPLTPETRHLINARTLALMKPQAFLINVARGAIVDEMALEAALGEGRLAGVGLDVLEAEPPLASHPLFKFENVVFTSHFASCSVEAYADLRCQVSEQVAQILRGEFPNHLVNSEVRGRPQCRLGRRER
jgi:D-3-phosphoglycerate dehydrogenase / 2-oxoglutarate reductase